MGFIFTYLTDFFWLFFFKVKFISSSSSKKKQLMARDGLIDCCAYDSRGSRPVPVILFSIPPFSRKKMKKERKENDFDFFP